MKTHSVKAADIKKNWFVIDAADQTVGRMASQIAYVLRGKHKPTFVRHLDGGDHVVVINASKVKFTGKKLDDKYYHHHTNYIGGIKSIVAKEMLKAHPERVIMSAVKGMLPHNKLGRQILKNLRVYGGTEHPHAAQNPSELPLRTLGGR